MKKILFIITVFISFGLHAQSPGNALNFDGTDDMVVVNSVPALFSDLTVNDFTFEAWVYPSGSAFQRIIYAQPSTSNFATMGTGTGNVIYFYVVAGGTTYSQASTTSIAQNQWTHVACRWTSATLTPQIFFNGVLQPSNAGGSSSTGTSGLLTIGTRPGGAQYFSGSLDEIRIWSEARTNCEIISNYNSEFTAAQPNLVAYYNFNQGIPAGPNAPFTTLPDFNATFNGTLTNFALTGATSNWISSGAVINNIGPNGGLSSSVSNTICAFDTLNFGGELLTTNGVYDDTLTASNGCDSIVILTLTVLSPITGSFNASACDSYLFNGNLETVSGMYYDTLTSASGCDSIVTLNLTINSSQSTTENIVACDQYNFNGNLINMSGTYFDTLATMAGCDSIITLNLTINTANTNVGQVGLVLTAQAASADYQWLDCNNNYAILPNDTNAVYTATSNGSFAVEITENGCIDTSSCYTINTFGVENQSGQNQLEIYPNPAEDFIFVNGITSQGTINLVNINGQLVNEYIVNPTSINMLDIRSLIPGIYFIQFVGENPSLVYKVVKK